MNVEKSFLYLKDLIQVVNKVGVLGQAIFRVRKLLRGRAPLSALVISDLVIAIFIFDSC